jgi:hypothetical protein
MELSVSPIEMPIVAYVSQKKMWKLQEIFLPQTETIVQNTKIFQVCKLKIRGQKNKQHVQTTWI